MSNIDKLNEKLRANRLPEIAVDDTFPEGSVVMVSNRPLPPGIEDHRVRLVETIDLIHAEAKRDVEALPVYLREERALRIIERAKERAEVFYRQLVHIQEMYAGTIVTVRLPPVADTIALDLPATPVTPSGSGIQS